MKYNPQLCLVNSQFLQETFICEDVQLMALSNSVFLQLESLSQINSAAVMWLR